MASRKSRRERSGGSPPARVRRWCQRRVAGLWRAAASRLRPWRPAVEADVCGKRGRRLRRQVARAARGHLRALGVTPPGHLLVVVQRTVTMEGRPLQALLQVFEDAPGRTRHVLYIALTVGARRSSDEDVVAMLRQQLRHVVASELGAPRPVAVEAPAEPPAAVGVDPAPEPSPLDELMLPGATASDRNGAFPADVARGGR